MHKFPKNSKIATNFFENRQKIASRQAKILSPTGTQNRQLGDKSPFLVTLAFPHLDFPILFISNPLNSNLNNFASPYVGLRFLPIPNFFLPKLNLFHNLYDLNLNI